MENFLMIVLAAVFFAVVFWLVTRQKNRQKLGQSAVDLTKCDIHATTPKGVKLRSVNPVRPEMIAACDYAFETMFEICRRKHNFHNRLKFSDYLVYIIPQDREHDSNGVYVPNFLLRADDYDGSIYDHDPAPGVGLVYAAEYCLPDKSGFVVPEYTRNFDELAAVGGAFHNGLDHLILFANDVDWYARTENHASGGGHPIIF
jgi:hypothetical protein